MQEKMEINRILNELRKIKIRCKEIKFDPDLEDELEDQFEDYTIKVKKIISIKKEGKNLYKVKAKIEVKEKGEKAETNNQEFYVMKKGMSCYVVDAGFDIF